MPSTWLHIVREDQKSNELRRRRSTVASDPMDKDRHLIDCVSYILLDDPQFIDQRRCPSTFQPIYPNLGH